MEPSANPSFFFFLLELLIYWLIAGSVWWAFWWAFKPVWMIFLMSRTDKAVHEFANAISSIPDVRILRVGTLFDSATDSPQLTFTAPWEFAEKVQQFIWHDAVDQMDPNLVYEWWIETWFNGSPQPSFRLRCHELPYQARETAFGFRWIPTPKRAKSDLKELVKIFWKATSLVDSPNKVSGD